MASDVEKLLDQIVQKGWHIEAGSKHRKIYTPDHKLVAVISRGHKGANYGSFYDLRSRLRRAGFDDSEPTRLKEKPVTSVSDLIKANGLEKPVAIEKEKRMSRKGLDRDIMVVLRGAYPNDVDITTLKMKVALNHPGVAQRSLSVALMKLKAGGYVLSSQRGYYRATSPVEAAAPPPPQTNVELTLPPDAQKVIEELLAAVANAETLIKSLQAKLAAYDQVKKLLAG